MPFTGSNKKYFAIQKPKVDLDWLISGSATRPYGANGSGAMALNSIAYGAKQSRPSMNLTRILYCLPHDRTPKSHGYGEVLMLNFRKKNSLFMANARIKVGDGKHVQFWTDHWIGNRALKDAFPRVFSLTTNKRGVLADFGFFQDKNWHWKIELRRQVLDWEQTTWENFLRLINGNNINPSSDDSLVWTANSNGIFSVSSYCKICANDSGVEDEVWKLVWSGLSPPNV
ncbi:hypothetical protein HRI_004620100 [Hibiscus trionum]|uniref:Uncharacterized protein n=1 Tax=Hibiscus trionum TaxID=183268 RepID=A0A9W7JD39_HIBTR|nr:hypothetical protein HRI_004620100 [Hibiscus trionum]